MQKKEIHTCEWVGDNEGCSNLVVHGKSYCQKHQDRIYLKVLPEMADFIIDKEVNDIFSNTN